MPVPPARRRQKPRDNEPSFEIRTPLHHLTGVDLSQLDGIGPYNALRLLSEIGTDMTRWATDKHFTSWLTLAPQNKISVTFPNAACAVALIDRLTHHAEIIPIEGDSYRKREADLTQNKRRAAP